MLLKTSQFSIQDKDSKDIENPKDFPTLADLMREQDVLGKKQNTVHRRRDLDCLG